MNKKDQKALDFGIDPRKRVIQYDKRVREERVREERSNKYWAQIVEDIEEWEQKRKNKNKNK